MNICVIGAGYVGLVTGACLAEVGHKVTCCDIDQTKLNSLEKGRIPFFEPDLEELVIKNLRKKNISFSSNLVQSIENAVLILIAVGTPSSDNGTADISKVEEVAREIGSLLSSYKVIAIKSTVPVGTCAKIEDLIKTNLKSNCQFDVISNPEFLREGSAISDMFNADRIIIGSESSWAANIAKEVYLPFGRPILLTKRESAELIKYASNSFLATKISFINEMADFCEKVDCDIEDVAAGMGMDSRIGGRFLKAGIGFGGSCFPKDLKALLKAGEQIGCGFNIINSALAVNSAQKMLPIKKLKNILGTLENKLISLWGLSFKPNTDDIREAPALDIIEELLKEGARIIAYDPIAMTKVKNIYPDRVVFAKDCYESAVNSQGIIIITEWDEFRNIDFNRIKQSMKMPVIIDGRNLLDRHRLKNMGFLYSGIGRGTML